MSLWSQAPEYSPHNMKKKKENKLGAKTEVKTEVKADIKIETPSPSSEIELKPDLMASVVGSKLLYGKKVLSCEFNGKYYELVDCEKQTFLKSPEELEEILK